MPYSVRQSHRAPAITTPIAPDPALPRVCVIGAGSSGLAAVKALYTGGIPFDCYEKGPVVGGNWVFGNPNGQSACYQTLEINTSCPRMAFSDFPMPAHYPQYARHDQVADYFEAYLDHFRLRDQITFSTTVTAVTRADDATWRVSISGPDGDAVIEYDAVIVANGHHWDPRWPDPVYPGTFDGEQMHAHDYRSASQLEGRDVVVVGSGNSALDIATEAGRVARSTHLSQRRGQWVLRKYLLGVPADQVALPGWVPWWVTSARLRLAAMLSGNVAELGLPTPGHRPGQSHPVQSDGIRDALRSGKVQPRPGIARLDGGSVEFVDGTRVSADLVVWATGYRVTFPFLDPALIAAEDNDLPLWKRTIHPDLPGLYFVGLLQPIGAVMPLAEAQSAWIAEHVSGRYVAPPRDEIRRQMLADHQRNRRQFYTSARHTMEVDFDHYLWDLGRERRRGARRARRVPA
ncbi:NAD(P)/FAD-dependent oxidoreductase [Microbacterium sp. SD291]|uniref:flavin-containing monooxygenase n=1 Tax=Microbacterium sp. SD291 TaxID=2782007 RepID=UPI001A95E134|nr:NAD(P)-binding domain-containing protein [Microbacterium sp. SD291]MBO0979934.1 NAD(P)-binding domain-containing protein [Microbacterium sp. SD291]